MGIYEIDLFLKAVNPNKAQKRSKVFSPDISMARRYTPKPVVFTASPLDMVVAKSGVTTKTITKASVSAGFLTSPWTLELVIRNWGESKSKTITGGATYDATNITLSVSYVDAQGIIGLSDPGTYDLYAINGATTSHIASGNLSINLAT
jgi:hypothetical protein